MVLVMRNPGMNVTLLDMSKMQKLHIITVHVLRRQPKYRRGESYPLLLVNVLGFSFFYAYICSNFSIMVLIAPGKTSPGSFPDVVIKHSCNPSRRQIR